MTVSEKHAMTDMNKVTIIFVLGLLTSCKASEHIIGLYTEKPNRSNFLHTSLNLDPDSTFECMNQVEMMWILGKGTYTIHEKKIVKLNYSTNGVDTMLPTSFLIKRNRLYIVDLRGEKMKIGQHSRLRKYVLCGPYWTEQNYFLERAKVSRAINARNKY